MCRFRAGAGRAYLFCIRRDGNKGARLRVMQKAGFLKYLSRYRAMVPDARDPGEMARRFRRYAATVAQDKQALAAQVWALLEADGAGDEALQIFAQGFSAADTPREVAQFRARSGQLAHVASLRTQLMLRARKSLLHDKTACPEYIAQDKKRAYRFADLLGIRRPAVLQARQAIDSLDLEMGHALKPPRGSGSRGVYLLHEGNRAVDLRCGIILPDRDSLRAALHADVAARRVPLDVWNVEGLIRDAATPSGLPDDWKFHCFYGEIMLMGHIRKLPQPMVFGLDHALRPTRWFQLDPTIPENPAPQHPCQSFLDLARRISLALPSPYIRVDLMTSQEGPVLSELTARPGVLHLHDLETDRFLGEALLQAEARLERDLMQGKPFLAYKTLLREWRAYKAETA